MQQDFGRLVADHYAAVAAVAYATTRDVALSEDVAQDTFIAAWHQRARLREVARVRPWLCAIARNQGKNALRRRRREVVFEDDMSDARGSTRDVVAEREQRRELEAALAKVPVRYREALVLFYWHEQSIAEVAASLAISDEAAQKRISRARVYLRDGLAPRLDHVRRAQRPAAEAATVVVAILAASRAVADAAPSSGFTGFAPTLRAAGWIGVGAALVGAIVWWRGAPACELRPALATVAHPATPRADDPPRVAEHATAADARPGSESKPQPREAARAPQRQGNHVVEPIAAKPAPTPASAVASGCEIVACALDGWQSACCRKMEREMPYCSSGGPLPCRHPPDGR